MQWIFLYLIYISAKKKKLNIYSGLLKMLGQHGKYCFTNCCPLFLNITGLVCTDAPLMDLLENLHNKPL